ncbi:MAG: HK97-gp10 family putative phage morphogenesis protein [Candidatus Hodarchaeales archaeon]|jgi:HK97 gp10 family phage protein
MAVRIKWYGAQLNRKALYLTSLAVEATAVNIWSTARQIVPVRTGRLRNSIRIQRLRARRGYVTYRIIAGSGQAEYGIRALGRSVGAGNFSFTNRITKGTEETPDAFYAIYVELGTVNMTAKPFMRPAFNRHKFKLKSTMRKIMRARL